VSDVVNRRILHVFGGVLLPLLLCGACEERDGDPSRIRIEKAGGAGGTPHSGWTREASRSLRIVEARLGIRAPEGVRVVLADSEAELDPRLAASFRPWTVALAWKRKNEVWLRTDRLRPDPPGDFRTVLQHEFVHLCLFALEERGGKGRVLPLWLHEGIAQEISGAPVFSNQAEILASRTAKGRFVSWLELRDRLPERAEDVRAAYAQSASFVSFLCRLYGLGTVLEASRLFLGGEVDSLDGGLARLKWDSFTRLQEEWERRMRSGLGFLDFLSGNCFSILLLLAAPLVFFVLRARGIRDREVDRRLVAWDRRVYGDDSDHEDLGRQEESRLDRPIGPSGPEGARPHLEDEDPPE